MKSDLVDSAVIVGSVVLTAVGVALIVAIPRIEVARSVALAEQAMEQIRTLVSAMNKQPLFQDMTIEEKWMNLKPEYDAIMDGILHNVSPSKARIIAAHCRVETNVLLNRGK